TSPAGSSSSTTAATSPSTPRRPAPPPASACRSERAEPGPTGGERRHTRPSRTGSGQAWRQQGDKQFEIAQSPKRLVPRMSEAERPRVERPGLVAYRLAADQHSLQVLGDRSHRVTAVPP